MKQQTAVEWLQESLLNTLTHQQQMQVEGLFQQAKEMEKEQIMKAHGNKTSRTIEQGCDVYVTKTGEQYYNETYNK